MTPQPKKNRTSTRVATTAVCAGLALGALGLAISEQRGAGTVLSDDPTTVAPVTTPSMTTGETSTEVTAPPAPETPLATPEITTTPTSAAP